MLLFYLGYLYRKVVTNAIEIKSPKLAAYRLHFAYVLSKFFPRYRWQKHANFNEIRTVEAKYFIRPNTFDAICASPDYERPDIELTKALIRERRDHGKSVLFIDVGANLGCYCLRIASAFRDWDGLSVIACEPFPESCGLLVKNIQANGFSSKIDVLSVALGDAPGEAALYLNDEDPGSNTLCPSEHASSAAVSVAVTRLDDLGVAWKKRTAADCVFLKLDCEGAEVSILRGAEHFLSATPEVTIMVEDCLDSRVGQYLTENRWGRFAKRTPYNSFWRKPSRDLRPT